MPIRFRCVYCNQLMGIARRKAGMVVRCPSCASQVTVPMPSGDKGAEPAEGTPPIFERSDFDELFNPGGIHVHAAAAPPSTAQAAAPVVMTPSAPAPIEAPAAAQAPSAPAMPIETVIAPPKPGIWISSGMAVLLCVVVVVALTLAFACGMMVGILWAPAR